MKSNKIISLINYLFIFLTINYRLFTIFIIKIDSSGYVLILLSILVLLFNNRQLFNIQFQKPIVYWLIWCLFAFINYYLHPHISEISLVYLYQKIFIPLIVMTVVIKEYDNDPKRLLVCCLITHIAYMILGYYFDSGILYRDLGEENVLGNRYAITICFTIFYLSILNKFNKINNLLYLIITMIVLFVLAMSGTRKAFGAGIIFVVFWSISIFNKKKLSSWLLISTIVIGGMFAYNYLMENTYMGMRMDFLKEQQEEYRLPHDAPNFLYLFGDRSPHYYYGWLNFLEKPILGVGAGQSRVNYYGYASYIHSEYMVQLTDNGVIGFSLFLLFYLWISKTIIKTINKDEKLSICMIGGLISILFLGLTAWIWEFSHYFIALGVIIGFCQRRFNAK